MKTELDVKDKRILHEIDLNARASNAEIAKRTGVSKQVAGLRIKKLLGSKTILGFFAVIDNAKLGFTIHKSFVRLQNIDGNTEQRMLEFLKNHPAIVWIASCDGRYDLAFGTLATNMAELDRTLSEIDALFGENVSERHIATILHGEYFDREYLLENLKKEAISKESAKAAFGAIPEPAPLDETDWKILLELGKNARATLVEIAKTIEVSPDTVAVRIKNIEKQGVIKRYNFVPNESIYPYLHYKVLVGLKNSGEERERALIGFCKTHPNIVYIVKALGPWDFEIDIEIESPEQLRKVMMELKTKFSDIIKDYSSLSIYQVHKYNFCPGMPNKR
ncbi:TPA: Lrp/AsnC family transcriptional regulator [Candidatus Micrarchaeota archaeon]|nr:Lrp/AsnC family transcriptional regulator [Candidatus Micrarchaeota archaeon]